jgi:hypothetical protein
MADPTLTLVGLTLFGSTAIIILLHAVEWFQIGTLPRTASAHGPTSTEIPSKLMILRGGLGVETAYYFLLLAALIVFFPSNIVFLTLVSILGLFHLGAFWALLGRKAGNQLQKLTSRRVMGVLLFDILELAILVALAFQLYIVL